MPLAPLPCHKMSHLLGPLERDVLYGRPHISPPEVGVKCPDDEISEQHILRAPAITFSDHRAVHYAKCGRPQGEGVGQMQTPADWGGGRNNNNNYDNLYGAVTWPCRYKGALQATSTTSSFIEKWYFADVHYGRLHTGFNEN